MKARTLIIDDEALARDRLRQLLASNPEVELIAECADGKQAVRRIGELSPDLIFLDVQMPELDGFGVLEAISDKAMPVIVFVTAHDKFALKAFEVHAVDYLLKPFDRERFEGALQHALEQVKKKAAGSLAHQQQQEALVAELRPPPKAPDRIAVKSGAHIVWLSFDEIDWIESADNYVELHVGAKSHLLRETLNALEERLPDDKFVRISRSAMVNASKVKELHRMIYGGYEVVLRTGARLRLSRRYRDKLEQLGVK
jgi:two-component system, LytTR family, response regulator